MNQLIASLISLLVIGHVFAATATATPTSTPKGQQIENLKERLATKVAELRQVQRKAIVGTVKAVSVSTITVETKTSDVKIELTDAIKVFQTIKEKRTALTTDNIAVDDRVVVFGEYDSAIDTLSAKVIIIQDALPERISGTISEVDKKNYTVSLTTPEGKTYVIDIEKNTQMFARDPETGVVKGGFSKLEPGDTTVVVGTMEPKKENQLSGIRLLDIGNMTGVTPTPSESPEATGSAAGKSTPKPTPKATPTPTVAS